MVNHFPSISQNITTRSFFDSFEECMKVSRQCSSVGTCRSFMDSTYHVYWKCECPSDYIGAFCQIEDLTTHFWILVSCVLFVTIIVFIALHFLVFSAPTASSSTPELAGKSTTTSVIDGKRYILFDGSRIKDD